MEGLRSHSKGFLLREFSSAIKDSVIIKDKLCIAARWIPDPGRKREVTLCKSLRCRKVFSCIVILQREVDTVSRGIVADNPRF